MTGIVSGGRSTADPRPLGTSPLPTHEVDLAIGGMTCASCSARIERKLNKLDGVQASVNLATERAHVRFAAPLAAQDLVATVKRTGYTARVLGEAAGPAKPPPANPPEPDTGDTATPVAAELDGSSRRLPADLRERVRRGFVEPSLRLRVVVAAILTVPVVLLAMVPAVGDRFGGTRPWLELLLTLPVVVWAAYPFHRAAIVTARHGSSTMDTLVSLGVSAAFGWSVAATLAGSSGHMYYEVAAVVTTFLLAGRVAEARAKDRGRSALRSLLELGAKDVAVLRPAEPGGDPVESRVPIEQLAVSELFVVRPGEQIATDGIVVEGSSSIDRSLVTGESMPVDAGPGIEVTGATLNTHGRLVVRATRVGAETVLAGITRLVEAAQTGKAPVQRLADRVSAVFVPVVLVLAAVTFAGWLATGHEAGAALSAAVTVLVIACPCALGLATPMALLVGTGRGAELGVLIKGPEILESTRRVDTVVLDKTGTVTTGQARLTHIATAGRLTPTAALQAAAAVESGSEHPIARAVVTAARERGLHVTPVTDFTNLPGNGARATITSAAASARVTVGRAGLFGHVPDEIADPSAVGTTVYVGWGDRARASLTVADEVRPSSVEALHRLRDLGMTTYLLTGDNEATARSVAAKVGIVPGHVIADVQPEHKHDVVTRLQRGGAVVAMVGDGVNDAAALAQADLGIAMGTGTDVAIDSADIVLVRPELDAVADAITLSRATLRIVKQNLAWAFGYNVLALPLAAFGQLNPMIAGAAMAASSVLVVTNSLRLRLVARRPVSLRS
ncbi:MAG TPA: heavy metal translocating P-type ATPase [Dermatophilaceae bacterium]|nr:heavy metal translocating P-type ATPase [Dermatophilaceae bacterium]